MQKLDVNRLIESLVAREATEGGSGGAASGPAAGN
jgi:hypothetical protein